MIGLIRKIALAGLLVLILININGCAKQPLAFDPDAGTLQIDGKLHAMKVLERKSFLIHPVHVNQYLLRDEGRGVDLVYEYNVADSGYEFDRGIAYTVDAVFDAKQAKMLAQGGGYALLAVEQYDGTVSYVITEEGLDFYLRLIYSSDYGYIEGLYRELTAGRGGTIKEAVHAAGNPEEGVRTRWSFKMLFMKHILSRVDYVDFR